MIQVLFLIKMIVDNEIYALKMLLTLRLSVSSLFPGTSVKILPISSTVENRKSHLVSTEL